MKRLVLISAIAMSGLLYNTANAQFRVRFGFHVGLPRVYVPARVVVAQPAPFEYTEQANYDGDEDYYYLPDVDAYYSVTNQCYFYNDGGDWVSGAYLPGAYRDFDWRSARHYEVRASRPYMHDDFYRTRFNGVTFNGQWDRRYDRGYANESRDNRDQYRNDDRRDDNRAGNNYRQSNRDEQHFSQNNFHGRDRDRGETRHGRS